MSGAGKNTKQKQPRTARVKPNICSTFTDVNNKDIIKKSIAGGELVEGIPVFNRAACEDVISGKNNTWIVLGRDRPSGVTSGNMDATQSGAIDIVVGRMGQQVRQCTPKGKDIWTDPIFSGDAGRIYICQQTTIDKNFKLAPGTVGSPGFEDTGKTVAEPVAESGIGIKADQVRVIARRSIKLVTMGKQEGPSGGDKNYRSIQGINIIAGNRSTGKDFFMEPMPNGHRLSSALTRLSVLMEDLAGICHQAWMWQDNVNNALANHIHIWGPGTQPTSVSQPLSDITKITVDDHADTSMVDYEEITKKFSKFRSNYCLESGDKYINSKWNFVN